MKLTERFTEQSVIVNSGKIGKTAVLEEMVDRLCAAYGLDKRDPILDAVLSRESKMSTGIGCGLAVPHAKLNAVDQMCIAACTIKGGLDFNAIDKQPVYLLFLIVSPENTTGPHIRALSSISRLMSDADIRKSLIAAESAVEFYERLKSGEAKFA
jgi:mannitol/fructose-specific phosphotransferase system IIA component (Ntr-type)